MSGPVYKSLGNPAHSKLIANTVNRLQFSSVIDKSSTQPTSEHYIARHQEETRTHTLLWRSRELSSVQLQRAMARRSLNPEIQWRCTTTAMPWARAPMAPTSLGGSEFQWNMMVLSSYILIHTRIDSSLDRKQIFRTIIGAGKVIPGMSLKTKRLSVPVSLWNWF